MKIEIGKIYVNKTWKYLAPCLEGHGELFLQKFNPVFKLAVGIKDKILNEENLEMGGRNIYILCDKQYKSSCFESFLNFVKTQDYFKYDYCPEADFMNSRLHMIIIEIPEKYHSTYDNYLVGRYSKMYDNEDSHRLFKDLLLPKEKEYKVLTKDVAMKNKFIETVNKTFGTELKETDFTSPFKEFELPLHESEEVFNHKLIKKQTLNKIFT